MAILAICTDVFGTQYNGIVIGFVALGDVIAGALLQPVSGILLTGKIVSKWRGDKLLFIKYTAPSRAIPDCGTYVF